MLDQSPGVQIRNCDIETVVALSQQLPEFKDPHGVDEYRRRLRGVPHLILAAYVDDRPVGFKVGYEREGQFYSWMGGVLPGYRRKGIAGALAAAQENWARSQGYTSLTFTTRNSHKGMLIFALKNGFDIVGFGERETVTAHRILLQKKL